MSRFVSDPADDEEPLREDLTPDAARLPTAVLDVGETPPLAPQAPLSPRDVRTILASLMVTMFLAALDQTIVATALPTIGRQFHDVSQLSWVITAYLLSSTAVAPLFGTLSDIYGRRVMIVASMTLFLAGSVACALAPSRLVLILARGLQGLGGGGILPLVQTVIADVVSPRERGQYQAYFSGVWMAAGIGGPILGGVFAEHLHWSMIFWINVPLGVLSLVLLLPRMRLIPVFHRRRKVDWLGGALLMASAVTFLLVLTWGGHRFPWGSPAIMAMLGAGLVLALSFIAHARRAPEPFLPLPLLGGSVVPYAITASGCAVGTSIGLIVALPLYYDAVYRLSASEAGLALIPVVAVSVLGAATAGRAMARLTHYKWCAIAGNGAATAVLAMLALGPTMPLWALLTALAVFAFGLGTTFPVSVVSIQNAVARHQVGTATGAMNFFRALMASFAVAAFSTILLMALGGNVSLGGEQLTAAPWVSADDMAAAFRFVFGAAALLTALAAACLIVMEERPLAGPAERSVTLAE
jgi:EmrB/QacA subfamily drug resistance transporter